MFVLLSHLNPTVKRLKLRAMMAIVVSFLLLSSAGCSTVKAHAYDYNILHPYLGTKTATRNFVRSFSQFTYYGEQILWAADVPLCLVADTVLFPYDLIVRNRRHNQAAEPQN